MSCLEKNTIKKKGASWEETLPCIHSQKSESCYIYYIYSLLRDFVFGLPSTTPLPSSCEEVLNIANCRGLLCAGTALSPPARCCVPLPPLLPIYTYIYTHTHTHTTHTHHTHTHTQQTQQTQDVFLRSVRMRGELLTCLVLDHDLSAILLALELELAAHASLTSALVSPR